MTIRSRCSTFASVFTVALAALAGSAAAKTSPQPTASCGAGGGKAASTILKVDTSIGTGPQPAVFHGHAMTPFAADTRPLNDLVTGVPAPGGGTLGFSPSLKHLRQGMGWGSWNPNFLGGDVYFNPASCTILTLPPNTHAFYFYVKQNTLSQSVSFRARAQDGTTSPVVTISGSNTASFIGFWSPAKATITSIAVNAIDNPTVSSGYGLGEFGISAG